MVRRDLPQPLPADLGDLRQPVPDVDAVPVDPEAAVGRGQPRGGERVAGQGRGVQTRHVVQQNGRRAARRLPYAVTGGHLADDLACRVVVPVPREPRGEFGEAEVPVAVAPGRVEGRPGDLQTVSDDRVAVLEGIAELDEPVVARLVDPHGVRLQDPQQQPEAEIRAGLGDGPPQARDDVRQRHLPHQVRLRGRDLGEHGIPRPLVSPRALRRPERIRVRPGAQPGTHGHAMTGRIEPLPVGGSRARPA